MEPEARPSITSRRADRSNTSCRHSRKASRTMGKSSSRRAASKSCPPLRRCCHKGARLPGAVGDMSRARAAHSRKRAANRAVNPTRSRTMDSSSSESKRNRSLPGRASSAAGTRSTMPSSEATACGSKPSAVVTRWATASAQGSCTRRPKGECRITRISPVSSGQVSTTSRRSVGTAPVQARWASMRAARLHRASSSSPSAVRRSRSAGAMAPSSTCSTKASSRSAARAIPPSSARTRAPRARPVS